MKKSKKILLIVALVLDVLVTLGLAVFNIIMLANTVGKTAVDIQTTEGYIGYLLKNPTVYLVAYVIPLFVLLAGNIVALVIYVRKSTKKEPVKVEDLSEEQLAALKQQVLEDLERKDYRRRPLTGAFSYARI